MSNDDYMDEYDAPQSDGLGTGLVICTSLVLIVAFILVEMALKTYGRGLFS